MPTWDTLFRKPDTLRDPAVADTWLQRIAERLLNGCRLVVGSQPHRFIEVEAYYFGEEHPDPFTHRDPVQKHAGRWYFHRTGGQYRSGSFKGLDIAFGDGTAFGGFLIRGLEKPDGTVVDGPSLFVDYLLDATGAGDVATLDRAIGERMAWASGNPLLLEERELEARPIYRSARVGLTLKRSKKAPEPPRYVMRPYRFLTEPRRTAKGKVLLVLALHSRGVPAEEIHKLTSCPKGTVQRYLADFEEGKRAADFDPFFGKELGPKELCQLYGTWTAHHGGSAAARG